jgi:thioredoxin 1
MFLLTCSYRLAKQYADEVHFVRVDVDESPDVAQELNIRAMPTFKIFKDGETYDEVVGAIPPKLEALVAKVVGEIRA